MNINHEIHCNVWTVIFGMSIQIYKSWFGNTVWRCHLFVKTLYLIDCHGIVYSKIMIKRKRAVSSFAVSHYSQIYRRFDGRCNW